MKRIGVALVALIVSTGCNGGPAADAGLDASIDGAAGLVRWGTAACPQGADGGAAPMDACAPATNHVSNTGLNASPDPTRFQCTASVPLADRTVVLAFHAGETHDPSGTPGALELRGAMGASVISPTVIGQAVQTCDVQLTEGAHTAVGHCGAECTVTLTDYFADVGTLVGTIKCAAMPDDSTPPVFRTVRQADGVPGMAADFSINGCALPP